MKLNRLMLSAIALISVTHAASITVTVPTGDVPTVFKAINAASGEEWTAPGFEREFLTVIVTDVEPENLRAKISETLGAEWRQENNQWVLYRDAAKRKELRDADVARLIPQLQAQLDKLKPPSETLNEEELQSLIDGDATLRQSRSETEQYDWQAVQRLREQSPGQRVIGAMVAQMDAAELVTLPPSSRTVYTIAGGPRQRRLPPACITIFERGLRDENWLRQRRVATTDQDRFDFGIFNQLPRGGAPWFISISNSGFGGLECRFNTFFPVADGTQIVNQTSSWTFTTVPNGPPETALPDAPGSEILIELSENERKFADMVRRGVTQGERVSTEPQSLVELFGEQEPYAFLWDNVLRALAQHRDLDIIAVPDVMSWYVTAFQIAQAPQPNVAAAAMLIDGPFSRTKVADGWLTIQPLLSAALASPEPDRQAIRDFFSYFRDGQEPSAMETARFVASSKATDYINIGVLPLLVSQTNNPSYQRLSSPIGWKGYRIVGSLSNAQLEVLRAGREVPVGQLPSGLRGLLDDWFYSDSVSQVSTNERADEEYAMYANMNPGEPTFLFPRGLPGDATMSVQGSTTALATVKVRSTAGVVYDQSMNVSTLAWAIADTSPNRNIVLSMVPISMASEKFALRAGGYERSVILEERSYPFGREPRSLAEMPEEFRKQVEALVAQYRQSGAGAAPPPTGNRRP